MTEDTHPIGELTDAALSTMLHRAIRVTLGIGLVAALILWIAAGWRNASMLAVGTAISAASILEWQRLIRLFNATLDRQKAPKRGDGRQLLSPAPAYLCGGHLW